MAEKLLEIKDLTIHYETKDGVVYAVNKLNLTVEKGKVLGLVGETGAGKTTTLLGIMRLLPERTAKVKSGQILFNGRDLLKENKAFMRSVRGNEIAMIFQDPMTALNPVIRVGDQIAEVIKLHEQISQHNAEKKVLDMFKLVGIPPERYSDFPYQFSGGMKQRVIIAIALACKPALLLADEPTTALDVTIQAQILELMRELISRLNTSVILVTHDLGVVAEMCDEVAVMYAGEVIEQGNVNEIFNNTQHPYTKGLLDALPDLNENTKRLKVINGFMPNPMDLPVGCKFAPRCTNCMDICRKMSPKMIETSKEHFTKCFLHNGHEQGIYYAK